MSLIVESPVDAPVVTDRFWQAAVDSMLDGVVVLDHDGEILAANHGWRWFADANGGVGAGVGENYLTVCDRAAAGEPLAAEVSRALRELLAGTRTVYECVYACHAPTGERWFSMRATPFLGSRSRQVVVVHHDVTTLHMVQRRSHEQAALLDAVDAAVIATDLDGIITHWSVGAEALYGWTADEVVGEPIASVTVGPADQDLASEIIAGILADGAWDGRFPVSRRDGASFPAYVRNRLLRDVDGAPAGVIGVSVDLSDQLEMERELDGARDFLATVTEQVPAGLIALDAAGRVTLINKAAEEMLGWLDGELLGELEHERIHAVRADGAPYPVDECPITIGRGSCAEVRVEDDAFQRRDGSLFPVSYSAAPFTTESGEQGWVVLFNDTTEAKARERSIRRELEALSLVGLIRDALDENRLVLYAQPIVDVASGETVQHELLVRMISPDGEVIEPGEFLPVAEKHDLIRAIDRRVLELAMPYAAAGHSIEVNLSADSISDPTLFGHVERLLESHSVDPSLVVFEITETALIDNEAVAQTFIENVRGLNCHVALDDFGTGFGSFRYLKHLPVSLLKIDQEFVRDLDGETSSASRHVIEAIVALAAGMGQKTVAEGVETESALAVLRELRVDYAQGYLFAPPCPADDIFQPTDHEE